LKECRAVPVKKGIYVTNGGDENPPLCRPEHFGDRLVAADLYDLDGAELEQGLAPYAAVLLPIHVDQRLLAARRGVLEGFLGRGGTIVINGHIAYPFLDGLTPFVPVERPRVADLEIVAGLSHPVFEGVARRDLTYRRGVAGFYGRGHNPPPEGAVPLNRLGTGDFIVDWVVRRPGGGRIFMHSGNNIWMYLGERSSAARLVPQLVGWALGEDKA